MLLPEVWIADDDRLMRELLKDALADVPCRLKELKNGDEVLAALAKEAPAVLLLDLMMPGKSGLELLREVRSRNLTLRVVIISGLDSEALVQQALKDGAHGYLAKPFHPLDVQTVVRSALEHQKGAAS